ncbi:PspC domain-containing protein [Sphingomonas sabuli]|uniref:PspC domain-containing protein n=1 Tax=Sphingomonas sabuli TaxID=2764186 RepID=A0A7G9L012_9SPHN|nr:PspC domain-containing protein [Sphingomonas sabuli]QNM81961.1 PspC domain-containing protein [Sphingomonas sabuli]
MARNTRYSLDRRDAKLAGVCATIGDQFGIDATFVRVGFVVAALLVSFKFVLAAYAGLGIWFAIQKKKSAGRGGTSEFDRMERATAVRPSVHAMRTELDPIDRRMMAIENHISKPNSELAREIEALRGGK